MLGLAAAEALITRHGVRVHLVTVEQEPGAIPKLREAAAAVRARLGASSLQVEIIAEDFLDLDRPRLGSVPLASFDYAIGNPPYFKVSPTDERVSRMSPPTRIGSISTGVTGTHPSPP